MFESCWAGRPKNMMRMVNIGGVGLVQFQHRLVYEIFRKEKIVRILECGPTTSKFAPMR